ncbi:hypothetical protein KY386_02100 [Candidatus Parcubacteria bacterium]|nr:hypothetical protein [Candidatus Parcubacteria bacterium]
MAGRLVILDFDGTVFDTYAFYGDILKLLHARYQVNSYRFLQQIDRYTTTDDGGTYDFFGHVRATLPLPAERITADIKIALAGRNYVYADAARFLADGGGDATRTVLTVGEPSWQAFKFEFAAPIQPLTKLIIQVNKGDYLMRHLSVRPDGAMTVGPLAADYYREVSLVDDKTTTFEKVKPRAGLKLFRIKRPGEKYALLPAPSHVRDIAHLTDIA